MDRESVKTMLQPGFNAMFGRNRKIFEIFLDNFADEICRRKESGLEWEEWCIKKMVERTIYAGIERYAGE